MRRDTDTGGRRWARAAWLLAGDVLRFGWFALLVLFFIIRQPFWWIGQRLRRKDVPRQDDGAVSTGTEGPNRNQRVDPDAVLRGAVQAGPACGCAAGAKVPGAQAKAGGYQGRLNRYTCRQCGHAFVTIDRDDGTTPFVTSCVREGCDGSAQSAFYRVEPDARPTHEWYRPGIEEIRLLRPATFDHVQRGGLLLRPIQ